MENAVRRVTGGHQHRQPALQVVRHIVAEQWPERNQHHGPMDFNHDPRTTYADVQRAFESARARLLEIMR